jgi:mono/diheme cytochrome c family protein
MKKIVKSFNFSKNIHSLTRYQGMVLMILLLVSCGQTITEKAEEFSGKRTIFTPDERARLCPTLSSGDSFKERNYGGIKTSGRMSFQEIRNSVNSACMTCHQSPSKVGGFTYEDNYSSFKLNAQKMANAILNEDLKKSMPPESRRKNNPDAFIHIGKNLNSWIKAQMPEGEFDLEPGNSNANASLVASGDLGECIPKVEAVGFDYKRDLWFSTLKKLPITLAETDLFTLDSLELAHNGTFSYNVEYPLWADNASKGRFIHVPYKIVNNKLTLQSLQYDNVGKKFIIPENTRFYKNFYKIIKLVDGTQRAKRIETRIIVVRNPGNESLFGTYKWDEAEQVATLIQTPYRDGTSFKDTVFTITTDEIKNTKRTYATPGRHRCLECHMGSENNNFVLGFTPLQINRRNIGEAGRTEPISEPESTQVKRLLDYGLIQGFKNNDQLPKLEWMGKEHPRNTLELRASGYLVGNCAHCHNPNGFAFTKENGMNLNLSAGEIFNFNTHTMSLQNTIRPIVHHGGDITLSHIYRKVLDPPEAQGMTSQMPMHTAGTPDCNVLTVLGQWIKSFGDYNEAINWKPDCKTPADIKWIDQDFTWPVSETYVPRRDDWKDPINGMPEIPFRQLELSPALDTILSTHFAVGYWNKKSECKFPDVQLPLNDQRPWMLNGVKPKRPFGEVYSTTPGAWFFRTSCMKCHGQEADGNTALARGILNWSGGNVRVANLKDGMFGNNGENLKIFDDGPGFFAKKNYAGNYLIWMAMKGTRVKFPDELSNVIGKHGGQMLNQIRDKCLRQISPEKASSVNYSDHEIFNKVCFQDNKFLGDPDLAFDPFTAKPLHPEKVEEWLDRAAYNGGWAIFNYLKEKSQGKIQASNDECEKVFPKTNN